MAYIKGNATTFNQLIQQGLSVADAAAQSSVNADAASYGSGTNSNAGAIIPGAGGDVSPSGLTQVSYVQPSVALDAQPSLQSATAVPVVDPRIIVGTPPPPILGPAALLVDEFSNIDAQVEANTAAAQPSPFVDEFTNIDAQVAANAAAAQESPFVDEFANIDAQVAANAAAAQESPYGDDATGVDIRVAANAAENVEQSDAETARLARLDLEATPNQSAAETNRLIDKNSQAVVGTQLAQRQAVLEAQRKLVNNGDWRVRLSLAAGADYLYNASSPGILAPLAKTGGVIFPYMPKIDMTYKANYSNYDLTHSNYRGYFYQNSYTDAVSLTATFTAQDTSEADYLLAVIHFFRSVTKMFYGQDAQRGAPPPMVYLTGLGEYQFAAHPCVVTSFQYSLPNDVDYIRAGSTNINGTNLITRRTRQDLPTNPITGAIKRLENLFSSQGINKGAITSPQAPPTLGKNSPTYVPTKIDCTISLLPMQTRAQVSQVFSLKSFANGDLIKGGFW
jgi:hypothetical protein